MAGTDIEDVALALGTTTGLPGACRAAALFLPPRTILVSRLDWRRPRPRVGAFSAPPGRRAPRRARGGPRGGCLGMIFRDTQFRCRVCAAPLAQHIHLPPLVRTICPHCGPECPDCPPEPPWSSSNGRSRSRMTPKKLSWPRSRTSSGRGGKRRSRGNLKDYVRGARPQGLVPRHGRLRRLRQPLESATPPVGRPVRHGRTGDRRQGPRPVRRAPGRAPGPHQGAMAGHARRASLDAPADGGDDRPVPLPPAARPVSGHVRLPGADV